jgi:plastocyanin
MKSLKLLLVGSILALSAYSAEFVVNQEGKTFIPNKLDVQVGDTIRFKNSDPFAHNAYSDHIGNEFDIGMQSPGEDVVIKMKKAGTVQIGCAIHPNMALTIEVK